MFIEMISTVEFPTKRESAVRNIFISMPRLGDTTGLITRDMKLRATPRKRC